jgi:alginate biosynthesis protein Alg44
MKMKAVTNLKIIHESETQRQHIRLSLPAQAEIDGKLYPVINLSAGGLAIRDISGDFSRGRPVQLRLRLPFSGFGLDINPIAEIRCYDPIKKTLGCSFSNISPDQVSLLNYVLKAFMAGDVTSSSDILNIAARNNFSKPRGQAAVHKPSLIKQIPGLLAVSVIGLLVAFFIASSLYNNLFLIQAADAAVTGSTMEATAGAEGTYHQQIDAATSITVRKDQIIGAIVPAGSGAPMPVTSPCDCIVAKALVNDGEHVASGTPVLSLAPAGAKPWVIARMDPERAMKLGSGTSATIHIFGSSKSYPGHITGMESIMLPAGQENVSPSVQVRIVPDAGIPPEMTGRPATVSFRAY